MIARVQLWLSDLGLAPYPRPWRSVSGPRMGIGEMSVRVLVGFTGAFWVLVGCVALALFIALVGVVIASAGAAPN